MAWNPLDWLTDSLGSSMGNPPASQPLTNATNSYQSPGSAPLSPDEMPQAPPPAPPAPPPPAINPATSDIGGGMPPAGTGAPPAPPTPMPAPRPASAPPPMAMNATPNTRFVPNSPASAPPPGPPTSLAPSPMPPPDSGPSAPPVQPYHLGDQTALGRSLGINPNNPRSNNFSSAMAGLGEGLTAAGNSKGKSGGQAFAAGAGGAITGASKQDNAAYDQRLKALHLAVQAQAEGDKAGYNKNYADYLKGKLANDAASGKSGGKAGAWNKPDSQKFIDAQNAMSKDPDIRASEKGLEQIGRDKGANSPEFAQAQAAHKALVQQKQSLYLSGVGLDPAKIQANIQNPPGTPQNPHVVTSKADFDIYVKPGQAYKNPADGKIYIRNKTANPADDKEAPAGTTEGTTPVQPPGPAPGTEALEPEVGEKD